MSSDTFGFGFTRNTRPAQLTLSHEGRSTLIEHLAHVGSDYRSGFNGQRVAVVGYSHWLGEEEEETANCTRLCVQQVVCGKWRIRFFSQIKSYFGYERHEQFWRKVLFFNYLPNCVGGASQRFHNGTPEQISHAQERFLRLISTGRPHKIFVFTSRRWAFPGGPSNPEPLGNEFPGFSRRAYYAGGHAATTFFLRHPQGARSELMRQAVKYALAFPPLEGALEERSS